MDTTNYKAEASYWQKRAEASEKEVRRLNRVIKELKSPATKPKEDEIKPGDS